MRLFGAEEKQRSSHSEDKDVRVKIFLALVIASASGGCLNTTTKEYSFTSDESACMGDLLDDFNGRRPAGTMVNADLNAKGDNLVLTCVYTSLLPDEKTKTVAAPVVRTYTPPI